MNNQRLEAIAQNQQYHILPIRSGMQLEIHERVGEGNNQRIWKFKGLVLKVKHPKHVDGTFTIRGKTSGMTIEKIYPLSFPSFEKVLLLDSFKIRRAKLYFLRDKVGKDARLKSLITSDERGMDLLALAKEWILLQEEILGTDEESNNTVDEEIVTNNLTVSQDLNNSQDDSTDDEATELHSEQDIADIDNQESTTKEDTILSSDDDITEIHGIWPSFKERLNAWGVYSFADIASLTDEKIAEFEKSDSMTSIEEWHNWIDQAKAKLA